MLVDQPLHISPNHFMDAIQREAKSVLVNFSFWLPHPV